MRTELAIKLARTERCKLLTEGLDLEAATDIPGAEWEPFQIDFLNDDRLLRHDRKSRQVGWSWTAAAESVSIATLEPGSTCMFLSINREESAEKIRYARQIYESLYPDWRVPLTSDNMNSLGFANHSRIISMPQRPARGKAKAKVYLDEFAHYRLDKEIYTGTFPVTTKGGRLRIGSTTLGARGMFWEIGEQKVRSYPGFNRVITPWYAVSALLNDEWRERLRQVTLLCATEVLDTEARVRRFGNGRINDIFDNLPLEDFQQEYEGAYVDETMAYISWADIQASTLGEDGTFARYWLAKGADNAFGAIDEMVVAVDEGTIKGVLTWGLDIGRKRDLTELVVMELAGGHRTVRAILSLDRQAFETQYAVCRYLLDHLPIVRGFMDQNGLGMQLAETLHLRDGYGERAMPMVFSNPHKSLMATHIKTRFQRRGRAGISIPNDRDLKYQVHSIRRRITANNQVVFDVEASERHHADKFWALALANEAAETLERVAEYPAAGTLTLRTTHRLDAYAPAALAPDLGDLYGFGITQEQFNTILRDGLSAALPLLMPAAPSVVDAYAEAEAADRHSFDRAPDLSSESVLN